jgi:hypothetical protein
MVEEEEEEKEKEKEKKKKKSNIEHYDYVFFVVYPACNSHLCGIILCFYYLRPLWFCYISCNCLANSTISGENVFDTECLS